jgi:hypothetical protein
VAQVEAVVVAQVTRAPALIMWPKAQVVLVLLEQHTIRVVL